MSDYEQFGFGDGDAKVGVKGGRLKMDKNEIARCSFLWWPGLEDGTPDLDATSPGFVAANRSYMKGVGYFISKGPEYVKIAGEPPKQRINTILVKWPVNKLGKIDVEAIQKGMFEVIYWVFDPNKYAEIKPIHADWHFGSHDLKITCTEAGFQKMNFSPCPDNILRKFLAKGVDHPLVQQIIEAGQALLVNVKNEIGRDLSIDQIKEKLGGGGGAVSSPVADVAATEDIDEALGDLLED